MVMLILRRPFNKLLTSIRMATKKCRLSNSFTNKDLETVKDSLVLRLKLMETLHLLTDSIQHWKKTNTGQTWHWFKRTFITYLYQELEDACNEAQHLKQQVRDLENMLIGLILLKIWWMKRAKYNATQLSLNWAKWRTTECRWLHWHKVVLKR